MMSGDYYELAYDNLLYLQAMLDSDLYNLLTVQAEQTTELMLKSVAERYCVGIEKLMHSHNLRAIYDAIHRELPEFVLNRHKLSTLKDFYFDAREPGDNFVEVTKDDLTDCLEIMYDTIREVQKVRERLGLPTIACKEKWIMPTKVSAIDAFG